MTAKIGTLDEIETALFEVKHTVKRAFQEYGGKPPEPSEIIKRAIVWRCLKVSKPHLILPKLAAMFPKDRGLCAKLAREARLDKRVRQTVIRIRARQIVGLYEDPVERVIAENYFQSARLSRPLVSLHREVAVDELESQLGVKITVEKYRRHLRSLFLAEYR